MFALLVLMVTFKSYPSVAEAGLYLALLPLWRPLAPHARYGFIVTCFYVSVTVLAPVMWTLWIHAGSANANFFFAVTLAYNAAQVSGWLTWRGGWWTWVVGCWVSDELT